MGFKEALVKTGTPPPVHPDFYSIQGVFGQVKLALSELVGEPAHTELKGPLNVKQIAGVPTLEYSIEVTTPFKEDIRFITFFVSATLGWPVYIDVFFNIGDYIECKNQEELEQTLVDIFSNKGFKERIRMCK